MGVGSDHFTFNFALKACARVMEQMEDGEKSYGFGMDRKGGEIHCRVLKLGKFNDGTLKLFREMQVAEVEAAEVTVISILGACAETGALEIGRKIHESLKHHKIGGCLGVALVDTYAKCGKLSVAWEVFSELKMKPVGCWDSMIMGLAVHGYCNDQRGSGIVTWDGNVELAEQNFRQLAKLEPLRDADYVLLSNIYAEAERWDDVERLRNEMIC
ncbi:hypothetical protein ACFX1Z_010151 [Malus domestica]